jgi:hypothetical protein
MLQVSPANNEMRSIYESKSNDPKRSVFPDFLGATVTAGDKEAWSTFRQVYNNTVLSLHEKGFFVGKEQHMYAVLLLNRLLPKPILVFECSSEGG